MNETLVLDAKLYPLSAIYGAAYVFIDKVYIRFEGDPAKKIKVLFKAKADTSREDFRKIVGDFENELLNYSLRDQIVSSNQKIRETLIAQALLSALGDLPVQGNGDENSFVDDPLGIAKTWEERFENKKTDKKKKQCRCN